MAKMRTLVVVGTVAGGAYWLFKSQDGRRLRERLAGGGVPQAADELDYNDERSEDLRRRIEETRRRLREQVGLPPEG